jgi:mannose-6-phosphate isomerase-like protein (cupin superfamily)
MAAMKFQIKEFPERFYRAPDGSQVRELPKMELASLAHCILEAGRTSHAIAHKTVSEIWHFVEGQGQVWLKQGDDEIVVDVSPRSSLTIPTGTHFQFRNTGDSPLCFLSITMPPWPGTLDEAYLVDDYWPTDHE